MADLTNLTDRLTHLRERKTGFTVIQGDPQNEQKSRDSAKPAANEAHPRERRFPTDYFVLFVYALLVVAVLTQFALIGWLDLI
jgi:hypothetical protein